MTDLADQVGSGAVTDVYLRGEENKVELFRHELIRLFLDPGNRRDRYSSQFHTSPSGGFWVLHFPKVLGEKAGRVKELINNATAHELQMSDKPFDP